ncbi:hypothetical protein Pelo_15370 [Pelomyxa schiedti]|nr:hypothetical protein Pelo_15370 [Pelomyxa schiedti]
MGCGATTATHVSNSLYNLQRQNIAQRGAGSELERAIEAHAQLLQQLETHVRLAKEGSVPLTWDDFRLKSSDDAACPMGHWLGHSRGYWSTWDKMEELHNKFHTGIVKVMDVAQSSPNRGRDLLQMGDLMDTSQELLVLLKKCR